VSSAAFGALWLWWGWRAGVTVFLLGLLVAVPVAARALDEREAGP
jgi:hypothetical protein